MSTRGTARSQFSLFEPFNSPSVRETLSLREERGHNKVFSDSCCEENKLLVMTELLMTQW